MEHKAMPSFTKAITGRNVTGILTVFGNLDSYNDIAFPGSFQKTINDNQARAAGQPRWRFLWNHNMDLFSGPPIAVIKGLREVARDELPEEVLKWAPDAMGGVEISRDYLETTRGDEVFKAIQAGAVDEMSYGFDPVKYDFEERDSSQIRNLREIRFWEGSDVLWGANPATLASKGLLMQPEKFLDMVFEYVEALKAFRASQGKAGARHSSADTKLLNAIHKAAVDLGATNCKGSAEEEETEEEDDASKKSRAGSQIAQPLTLRSLQSDLQALELSILA